MRIQAATLIPYDQLSLLVPRRRLMRLQIPNSFAGSLWYSIARAIRSTRIVCFGIFKK